MTKKKTRLYVQMEGYSAEKVRVEHNLICTAHNLKVIRGKLERNVPVIGTIRTLVANSVSKEDFEKPQKTSGNATTVYGGGCVRRSKSKSSKVGNFLRVHAIIKLKCPC